MHVCTGAGDSAERELISTLSVSAGYCCLACLSTISVAEPLHPLTSPYIPLHPAACLSTISVAEPLHPLTSPYIPLHPAASPASAGVRLQVCVVVGDMSLILESCLVALKSQASVSLLAAAVPSV